LMEVDIPDAATGEMKRSPELVFWVHASGDEKTRTGRVVRIDEFNGLTSIMAAQDPARPKPGYVICPNTGLRNHQISEGKTKAHKAGIKKERPVLPEAYVSLRALWNQLLSVTAGMPTCASSQCFICNEDQAQQCGLCGLVCHKSCCAHILATTTATKMERRTEISSPLERAIIKLPERFVP